MADDGQYASAADTSTMKRKYEEHTDSAAPPPRRPTGFSAPINSSAAALPDSGQSPLVPDGFELAKQKAQELAARIYNNASTIEAKRPRVENNGAGAGTGGGGHYSYNDTGYGPGPTNYGQPQSMSIPAYSSYQGGGGGGGGGGGSSKKLQIPNGRVGVLIGKGGETIKYLQAQSGGAKIQITRDADADPNSPTRAVELTGTPEQIAKAEQLINEVLAGAEAGGSAQGSRRGAGPSGSGEQFVMKIPNNKVGLVIGKGGETIKNMQATTGARIQVIPLHLPPGDTSLERTLQIDGTTEQIEAAKLLVNEVISENRPRNSSMGGGYSQQGYQVRPPTNWSQQGPPMQQYGYAQPQYQQQSYGAYPSQPNSGGYAANQSTEGSGYDYYNQQPSTQQQPSQGAPGSTDTTGYNYGQQQQATGYTQQGQGYSQDGFSNSGYQAPAPQSGYNQPQSQGYDQQGYNYSYGTQGDAAQAPPTGQPSAVAQQGYTAQQPGQNYGVPPASQTGYGTQQSGYGTGYGPPPPQAQKSPAGQSVYGQTQQSPTAQGAYGQPAYPSYAQPDATTKHSPSSLSTPPAQSGYGVPPPYGGSGYAQAPPYNSGYGGGYAHPPAYSANTAAATTPSAAPKASPQS